MTSKGHTRSNANPTDSAEPSKKKRQATVYDAVAARISANGFIPELPIIAATRDLPSSSISAVSPEAVLFRRKNAPTRYEESDFYFASDSLPPRTLPESDLLKALHCYTSDFYSRAIEDNMGTDWRSMDETALLALGILMEELCRDTLGDAGDMVFTECELTKETPDQRPLPEIKQSVVRASEAAAKSGSTRRGKRRRLDQEDGGQLND